MSILLPNMRDLSDEMLYLVLETLRAILALDKDALNPETVRVMAEMVSETWLQNSTGQSSFSRHRPSSSNPSYFVSLTSWLVWHI